MSNYRLWNEIADQMATAYEGRKEVLARRHVDDLREEFAPLGKVRSQTRCLVSRSRRSTCWIYGGSGQSATGGGQ